MKNNLIFTALFATMLTLFSCSNDFELIDTYKDIPVVYAIVSKADTASYFRVERVFVDEKIGAPQIAQIPDSLYYDASVEVVFFKQGNANSFKLQRVDGNLEGYVREKGAYAQTPNILYKIKASTSKFVDNEVIRVVVRRKNGTILTEGSTTVLPDMILNAPDVKKNNTLYFDSKTNFNVAFTSNTEAARLFDVRLVLNIEEQDPANPTQYLKKSLEWFLERNVKPSVNAKFPLQLSVRTPGTEFYKFLANNLVANGRKRIFKTIEVVVDASGTEVANYINATSANTGITGTEVLPNYTNMTKGFGIVSSKGKLSVKPIFLDDKNNALDTLRFGQYTKKLLFQ